MPIDTSKMAFPKPKKRRREPIKVYRDGREICDRRTDLGAYEYRHRVVIMFFRQGQKCGICKKRMELFDATFEHQDGRGMGGGHRDDRIIKDGKPYNFAAHSWCNNLKGSKRLEVPA